MEFQQQVGRSKIEARVRELAIYARLRLQPVSGLELLTPADDQGRPRQGVLARVTIPYRAAARTTRRAEATPLVTSASLTPP